MLLKLRGLTTHGVVCSLRADHILEIDKASTTGSTSKRAPRAQYFRSMVAESPTAFYFHDGSMIYFGSFLMTCLYETLGLSRSRWRIQVEDTTYGLSADNKHETNPMTGEGNQAQGGFG